MAAQEQCTQPQAPSAAAATTPVSPSTPEVITSPKAMRAWAERVRARGESIALVPTLGALHAGHLSLVDEAKAAAHHVVVSIFVNPAQFAGRDEAERYPRSFDADVAQLQARGGVSVVFAPHGEAVYGPGYDTYIAPERLSRTLCGRSRPYHFRGVCTVVGLMMRITLCDVLVLGDKDYQQKQVLRRMIQDLWLDVEVRSVPIMREPDGLAMSSRNAELGPEERQQATALVQTLAAVEAALQAGERHTQKLLALARARLAQAPLAEVDYLDIVDAEELSTVSHIAKPVVVAISAYFGNVRLVDSRVLTPPDSSPRG